MKHNTSLRHRKKRPKVVTSSCRQHGPFDFKMTDKGMKRTCRACGFSVTESTNRSTTDLTAQELKNSRMNRNLQS